MNNKFKNIIYNNIIILPIIFFIIDRILKSIFILKFKCNYFFIIFKNFLYIIITYNKGVSFNFFYNNKIIIYILNLILIIYIFFLIYNEKNKKIILNYLLIIIGAFSNLIDRFCFGYVIDYFYLNFLKFFIFNFADVYIFLGIFLNLFLYNKKKGYFLKKK